MPKPKVTYRKAEQELQRELVPIASELAGLRRRVEALLAKVQQLPSYSEVVEAGKSGDFDLICLHPVNDLVASLEVAAGNLRDDARGLRRAASFTPLSLAAEVRKRRASSAA